MRIIAGSARGRRLRAPRTYSVRPTADRVKESLFNVLGPAVEGARVLDLFAGSGNLGLEALSRGAREAVFVERAGAAADVIRANLELCGLRGKGRVLRRTVVRALVGLHRDGEEFDLVFMDPPYRRNLSAPTLALLECYPVCPPDALVVVECERRESLGAYEQWATERRTYGDTAVCFITWPPGGAGGPESAPG